MFLAAAAAVAVLQECAVPGYLLLEVKKIVMLEREQNIKTSVGKRLGVFYSQQPVSQSGWDTRLLHGYPQSLNLPLPITQLGIERQYYRIPFLFRSSRENLGLLMKNNNNNEIK